MRACSPRRPRRAPPPSRRRSRRCPPRRCPPPRSSRDRPRRSRRRPRRPPPPRPPRTCGSLEYALGASRGRERTCRERRRASPRRAPRCSRRTSPGDGRWRRFRRRSGGVPRAVPLDVRPPPGEARPCAWATSRRGARRAGAAAHRSRAGARATPPLCSSCRSNRLSRRPSRSVGEEEDGGWGAPSFAPARGRESHSDEPRIIASGSLFGGVDSGSVPPPLARGPVCAREGDGSSEGSFASRAPTTEKSRAR